MSPVEWLLIAAVVAGLVWAVVGVADHRARSRPLPPVVQPVRHAPFPLHADLPRARAARAERAGRHRRL